MKGFFAILAVALLLGLVSAHHVSEYENLPAWARVYNIRDQTQTAAAQQGLANLFNNGAYNLGLATYIGASSATQFAALFIFNSSAGFTNNSPALTQYLDSATFTNAYNISTDAVNGVIHLHEDEDSIPRAAGQYNVMTLYNVANQNNLKDNVEDNFEDKIENEPGFVEFIGLPLNNNAQYLTSVIFQTEAQYNSAIAKVTSGFFTNTLVQTASVAGSVTQTLKYDHHPPTSSGAAALFPISFLAAAVAYLLF